MSLLLLFGLFVGLLTVWGYLDSIPEQQATLFCDAIALDSTIDAAHFKQTLLRTQPAVVFGYDDTSDLKFAINTRHGVITEQKIAASGMDEFLSKAGGRATNEKQVAISALFHSSLPYSGYMCEIHLEQQRVTAKRVIAWD